jgi:altronate dehydratase
MIVGGTVFSIRDDGMASCLELLTFTTGQGNTVVVRAPPTLEVLARNPLNEYTVSAPAIANGSIHLRTEAGLRAIAPK